MTIKYDRKVAKLILVWRERRQKSSWECTHALAEWNWHGGANRNIFIGSALGMFEMFGRIGPPILGGGRQFWHPLL